MLGPRANTINTGGFLARIEALRYDVTMAGAYRPYQDVLRSSIARGSGEFGLPYEESDGDALVTPVPTWCSYFDALLTLEHLHQEYKLANVTNSDDDIMALNVANIGVPTDRVITSEQAGPWKPLPGIFVSAVRAVACEPHEIIQLAQVFEYDIVPGHTLGGTCVWINRYGHIGGPACRPYHELPDLPGLPALVRM